MTFITIARLRERGYKVTLDGVEGPAVTDAAAMDAWLGERWPEIEAMLRVEANPAVQEVLGGRLREVHLRRTK